MMAVYDLEEQEQIDEVKAWWQQYRKLVLLVVVAATVIVGGIPGWRYYHMRQALEAGELYAQLRNAAASGDQARVRDIAAALVDKYPRTGYATLAALAGAKNAFDTGDTAGAKARLQWAINNAKDDEIRDTARLRLTAVLLDEKQYDDALRLLETKPVEPLTALYADLRGDVLVAQGKPGEARGAYQLALDKSDANSTFRAVVQIKLDALGDAK